MASMLGKGAGCRTRLRWVTVTGMIACVVLATAGACDAAPAAPVGPVVSFGRGAAGYGANRKIPSLEMHESEVGFQEVIDPYARADFFISFGEQGALQTRFAAAPFGLPAG